MLFSGLVLLVIIPRWTVGQLIDGQFTYDKPNITEVHTAERNIDDLPFPQWYINLQIRKNLKDASKASDASAAFVAQEPELPHWYLLLQERKEKWANQHTASPPIGLPQPPPPNNIPQPPPLSNIPQSPPPNNVPQYPPAQPPQQCPKDLIHDRSQGIGYYFSWFDRHAPNLKLNWNEAIQFCRDRCMELVSLETKEENDFVARHIERAQKPAIWTSGRLCDFEGCNNPSFAPPQVYRWFWAGSQNWIPPSINQYDTNWSVTGSLGRPQPDNQSGQIGLEPESCIAVRNNAFTDGIRWHDEACSLRIAFVCEERPYSQFSPYAKSANHNFQYFIVE